MVVPLLYGAQTPPRLEVTIQNDRETVVSLIHLDQFDTQFIQLNFSDGCLEFGSGRIIGPRDSLVVTVTPMPGVYGFRLTPEDMSFTQECRATVTFFYDRYADLSTADGSAAYLDRATYGSSLNVWEEQKPGWWAVAPLSQNTGLGAIEADLEGRGAYMLAAPR